MKWQLTEDPEPLIRLAIAVFLQARKDFQETPRGGRAYQDAKAFLCATTWAHLLCEIDGDLARETIVAPLEAMHVPPPPARTLLGKRDKLELAARICRTTKDGARLCGYTSNTSFIRACRQLGIQIRCLAGR